ncbi:hypothetical protein [Leekyejoonella antrihumi]|uniref:Uncharacterized protein n=1 Tax=Leekyejoonella antrihumi TaxID=1660198 RepID=A0A563DW81_9MICO|nr:hypothetical protein [Leekyejoonella antrihumi]TWP34455.1 hypothetical protein FGL98_17210 [Leekyejoonella antrihumi]
MTTPLTHGTATRLVRRALHRLVHGGTPGHGESGFSAVWMAVIVAAMMIAVGLVADVGAQIRLATHADTVAAEAARAAAGSIDPRQRDTGAGDQVAMAAAQAFLAQAGTPGTVAVIGPGLIEVTVTESGTAPVLARRFSVTRTATARLEIGVTKGQ